MGNLLSCASGRSADPIPPSPSAPAPTSLIPPEDPVARVLLLEGGALTFPFRVKVIKLLLDYPFHVICSLDSLRQGQDSLISSLLPDEELELGQLYLLLPLRTFENEQCMPSMLPIIRRSLDIENMQGNCQVNRQRSMPKMREMSDCNNAIMYSEDNASPSESAESAKLLSFGGKSEMGFIDSETTSNNLYVGDSNLEKSRKSVGDVIDREDDNEKLRRIRELQSLQEEAGFNLGLENCSHAHVGVNNSRAEKLYRRKSFELKAREDQKVKKLRSTATFCDYGAAAAAGCKERVKLTHGITRNKTRNNNNNDDNNNRSNNNNDVFRSPLCDTPELQMAYRSAMLRRSRSWTPRLQPITENKRLKSASFIPPF